MTNDDLFALIGPWAKTHEPVKYEQTIAVGSNAATFRRYLIRLVEIRCEQEPEWRRDVPLTVLDESGLSVTLRHPESGVTMQVQGRRAPGTRRWAFAELPLLAGHEPGFIEQLAALKEGLDLEFVRME